VVQFVQWAHRVAKLQEELDNARDYSRRLLATIELQVGAALLSSMK